MRLYGIAIAVLPQKNNAQIFSVTCTPIAIDQNNQREFTILDNLKYTQDFDSMNVTEATNAFIKVVNTIESVTKLQEMSCKKEKVPYIPIGLDIGQHSKNKIKLDALYTLLFGETTVVNYHLLYKKGQEEVQPDIDRYKAVRKSYLAEHKHFPHVFVEACKKVPNLATKCVFHNGGYVPPTYKYEAEHLTPNALDKELKQLKPRFLAHEPGVRERLIELAQEAGNQIGKKNWLGNLLNLPAPRDYANRPELKEQLPRYDFYSWDPEIEEAFHQAYSDAITGVKGRHTLVMPHHQRHPFFTDPVADIIRTQFEILEGKRAPDDFFEHAELLQREIGPIGRFVQQQTKKPSGPGKNAL